jgi:hypothetical protein
LENSQTRKAPELAKLIKFVILSEAKNLSVPALKIEERFFASLRMTAFEGKSNDRRANDWKTDDGRPNDRQAQLNAPGIAVPHGRKLL